MSAKKLANILSGLKPPAAAFVEWHDACYAPGECDIEDLSPERMYYVGWVIQTAETHIVMSIEFPKGSPRNPFVVPLENIRRIRPLRVPRSWIRE